jgi:hypothetical protein
MIQAPPQQRNLQGNQYIGWYFIFTAEQSAKKPIWLGCCK